MQYATAKLYSIFPETLERRVPLSSVMMQEHGEYWLQCCERDRNWGEQRRGLKAINEF